MTADYLTVNGTDYRRPERPVVVVCIDGGDPAYIEHGVAAGIIPNIERWMRDGFHTVAHGTMPSFTCPNNMSIVTGRPASVHGISGNFYLDRATNEPVVMTGPELLKVNSVMSEFSRTGARVVSVTAKDKLRRQLQKGMDLTNGSVSFSSQHADRCTMEENGIEDALGFVGQPLPDMYSADLSLFVLDAGLEAARGAPPGHPLPLAHRLHPARPRTGASRGRPLLRGDGRALRQVRGAGCDRGAHRRPRHEREDQRRRHALRGVAAGHSRRRARRGDEHRHLSHHRRLRGSPRRARRLRAGVLQRRALRRSG